MSIIRTVLDKINNASIEELITYDDTNQYEYFRPTIREAAAFALELNPELLADKYYNWNQVVAVSLSQNYGHPYCIRQLFDLYCNDSGLDLFAIKHFVKLVDNDGCIDLTKNRNILDEYPSLIDFGDDFFNDMAKLCVKRLHFTESLEETLNDEYDEYCLENKITSIDEGDENFWLSIPYLNVQLQDYKDEFSVVWKNFTDSLDELSTMDDCFNFFSKNNCEDFFNYLNCYLTEKINDDSNMPPFSSNFKTCSLPFWTVDFNLIIEESGTSHCPDLSVLTACAQRLRLDCDVELLHWYMRNVCLDLHDLEEGYIYHNTLMQNPKLFFTILELRRYEELERHQQPKFSF